MEKDKEAPHKEKPEPATDWNHLEQVTDEEIERSVRNDPDAAPILSDEQMKEYKITPPKIRR